MAKTDIENVRKARKVPVLATGADLDTGFGDPIFRHDDDEGQRRGKRAAAPRRFGREAGRRKNPRPAKAVCARARSARPQRQHDGR